MILCQYSVSEPSLLYVLDIAGLCIKYCRSPNCYLHSLVFELIQILKEAKEDVGTCWRCGIRAHRNGWVTPAGYGRLKFICPYFPNCNLTSYTYFFIVKRTKYSSCYSHKMSLLCSMHKLSLDLIISIHKLIVE